MYTDHTRFMMAALQLAEQAAREGEIPVGAVVVKDGEIIGKGYNQIERLQDPTAHAEILALTAACTTLESKYLHGATLYVTMEPCPMCAGALVWSKIDRLVFGTLDAKAGASGSIFNITQNSALNHQVEVIHGVLEQDAELLLREFFKKLRKSPV